MLKIPGSMGVAHIDLGSSKGVLVLIIRWVSYQPGWSRELFVETSVAVLCDFFEIIHPKLGQIQEYPRRVGFVMFPEIRCESSDSHARLPGNNSKRMCWLFQSDHGQSRWGGDIQEK